MRRKRHVGPASDLFSAFSLLSGLAWGLVLAAGPVQAQSPAPEEIGRALRSLQLGLVELPEVTPAILALQRELVEALRSKLAGMKKEYAVGQQAVDSVLEAELAYWNELETLKVMEARTGNSQVSQAELLQVRIRIRSAAVKRLKEMADQIRTRYRVGEVLQTDVEEATARALKAEIMLEALRAVATRGNSTTKLR